MKPLIQVGRDNNNSSSSVDNNNKKNRRTSSSSSSSSTQKNQPNHSSSSSASPYKRFSVAAAIQTGFAANPGPLSEEGGMCPGSKVFDFDILKILGRGAHGIVHLAKSKLDGQYYVLKEINVANLKEHRRKRVVSEVLLLRRLRHPNIIQYYTSFVDTGSLYIVMEYANAGDMYTELKTRGKEGRPVDEEQVWDYFQQCAAGIQYLHGQRIIHRDVKSMNIFLTSKGKIKLGDLGVSRLMEEDDRACEMSRVGTPMYFAPELVKREPYDYRVDIWSLGCLIYTIMQLRPPFRADNIYALAVDIVKKPPAPLPRSYSSKLRHLVSLMLEKIPDQRPSIKQLIQMFPIHLKEEIASAGKSERINGRNGGDGSKIGKEMGYDQKKKEQRDEMMDLGISLGMSTISMSTGTTGLDLPPSTSAFSSSNSNQNKNRGSGASPPQHRSQTAAAWGKPNKVTVNGDVNDIGRGFVLRGMQSKRSYLANGGSNFKPHIRGSTKTSSSKSKNKVSNRLETELATYKNRSSSSNHNNTNDTNNNNNNTNNNRSNDANFSLSPGSTSRRRKEEQQHNNSFQETITFGTNKQKTRPASASLNGRRQRPSLGGTITTTQASNEDRSSLMSSARNNIFSGNSSNGHRKRPQSAATARRKRSVNNSSSNRNSSSSSNNRNSNSSSSSGGNSNGDSSSSHRQPRQRPQSAAHRRPHRNREEKKQNDETSVRSSHQRNSRNSSHSSQSSHRQRRQRPQSAAPRERKQSFDEYKSGDTLSSTTSTQARRVVVSQWRPTLTRSTRSTRSKNR